MNTPDEQSAMNATIRYLDERLDLYYIDGPSVKTCRLPREAPPCDVSGTFIVDRNSSRISPYVYSDIAKLEPHQIGHYPHYKDSMCIMRSMMKFVLRPMTYPPFSALSSGRSYRNSCAYCGNRASIAMSNQNYESQGPDILSCGYVISALQKKKRCGDR